MVNSLSWLAKTCLHRQRYWIWQMTVTLQFQICAISFNGLKPILLGFSYWLLLLSVLNWKLFKKINMPVAGYKISHAGTLKQRNSYQSILTCLCCRKPTVQLALQYGCFRTIGPNSAKKPFTKKLRIGKNLHEGVTENDFKANLEF